MVGERIPTDEYSMADAVRISSIHVVGERHLVVPPTLEGMGEFETQSMDRVFHCSSGEPIAGEWVGISIDDLLETVDRTPETTHVLVEGADDYRVCVPIADALEGLLAFRRGGGADTGVPRFVAPGVSGTRTVKHVTRIETVSIGPDDDPGRWEHLGDEDA